MPKEIISTDKAPLAIGPYSQGIKAGNFVYFSGQIPIDPETNQVISGDIKAQTIRVLENIEILLNETELNLESVVKTTIFLTNLNDFTIVNEIYGSYFKENPPARSCVEASNLPKGVSIEIECIAFKE